MKKTVSIAVLMAAFAAPGFGCERPTAPGSIPDGKTAAMEEMMAAKRAVDAFKTSMEEYLACEKSAASKEAAQKELVRIADQFNVQVRAFKAKG